MLKLNIGKKCDKCSNEYKIMLPYGPHTLCTQHFNAFFENRIRKNIHGKNGATFF